MNFMEKLPVVWQIVKYGISGMLGGVLQVVFLYLFVDVLGLWYLQGVVVSYFVALVVVFSLQKFWTFKDNSVDTLSKQSLLYTLIAFGSLIANVLGMFVLVDLLHVWHIAAQVLVVGVVGAASFLLNKKFTFNKKTLR